MSGNRANILHSPDEANPEIISMISIVNQMNASNFLRVYEEDIKVISPHFRKAYINQVKGEEKYYKT